MDARKKIKQYIGGNPLVLAVAVMSLLVGIIATRLMPTVGGFVVAVSIVLLMAGISQVGNARNAAKCLKLLEREGCLEQAARELEGCEAQEEAGEKFILTENFIFFRGRGCALRYRDALWVYKLKSTLLFFITTAETLVISSPNCQGMRALTVYGSDKKGLLTQALVALHKGNSGILLGYDAHKVRQYKQMTQNR